MIKEGLKKLKIPFVLFLFGLTSMFTDISSEMITPILPFFIASLGGSMAVIGLVGGISDGFSSVLKLFSGYISDRFHRKRPFIFWGYTISAISKFMLLFANTWLFILFQRMLDRIGKGARDAPRDAYISVLTKSHRGRIFSIHKFMDNLGATIGTIIAIVILYFFEYDYLLVFAAAIVFALIGLVPLLFVKDVKEKTDSGVKFNIKDLDKKLGFILLIFGIFGMANFTYMLFIMKAQIVLGLNEGIILIMCLYLLYNFAAVILTYPAGLLYDKIGKHSIIIGFVLYIMTLLGFIFASNFWSLIIFFIIYGLSVAFIDGNARALISDISRQNVRGTALGTYYFVVGLVALPSGWFAGLLWERINPNAPFILAIVLTIISIMLLLLFKSEKSN